MMILADNRYQNFQKRSKLPKWITTFIQDANLKLSTDMCIHVCRHFLQHMSQIFTHQLGKTLLSENDLS